MAEKQTLLNPTKIRQHIIRSREFFEGSQQARTAEAKSRLLGSLAAQIAERGRERLSVADRLSFELFELAIPFANTQLALNKHRSDKADNTTDLTEYYDTVTGFNHTVKAIYELLPDMSLDAVPNFVGQVVLEQLGAGRGRAAVNDTRSALWGMRKEVAWEQIAQNVPGVEAIEGATLEMERQHIDYRVFYRGKWLVVDVKSSAQGVSGALARGNNNAVCCPVPSDAFGERFALPPEEVSHPQYITAVRQDLENLLWMQHGEIVA